MLIINAIPNVYAFYEGEYGDSIGDGGTDMFDGGNFLSTNNQFQIPYSNNKIAKSNAFGKESAYFTRKYEQGLFAMMAENKNAKWFQSFSNYGRDGDGEGDTLELVSYRGHIGYLMRIYGGEGECASVNKLIVLKDGLEVKF